MRASARKIKDRRLMISIRVVRVVGTAHTP